GLTLAAFPGACFSSFIAANSFKTTMPKINPFISVGIGAVVSIILAVTGVAGNLAGVFGLIGASFGPICGAMMVDRSTCRFQSRRLDCMGARVPGGHHAQPGEERPGGPRACLHRWRRGVFPLLQDGDALSRRAASRRAGRSDQVTAEFRFLQPAFALRGQGGFLFAASGKANSGTS